MSATLPINWVNGHTCTMTHCDHYHYYEPIYTGDTPLFEGIERLPKKQKHPPRHFSNSGKGKQRKW